MRLQGQGLPAGFAVLHLAVSRRSVAIERGEGLDVAADLAGLQPGRRLWIVAVGLAQLRLILRDVGLGASLAPARVA